MATARGQRAFSLIEVLVVIALLAITGGLALMVSMETYRGTSFRTERNMVIALLQRARAQSVANYCGGTCVGNDGAAHGVYIDQVNHRYVLYQGPNYAGRDTTMDSAFDANSSITI